MARNQSTLTFAGDTKQLEKAFDNVGASTKKMTNEVAESNKKLDKAKEKFDTAEQRAMGFRDSLTGGQDAMAGFAAIAKGDLFSGLFLVGAGIGDLASSVANLFIPALKSMIKRLGWAKLAMTGLGVAAGAGAVALLFWGQSARHTSDDIKGLAEDIDRFVRTGKTTATLKKHFGEGAQGVAEFEDKLRVATASWYDWNNYLNRDLDTISRAKSAFQDLDTAMAQMVEQGTDGKVVVDRLAEAYGRQNVETAIAEGLLPKYSEALARASEKNADAARSTDSVNQSLIVLTSTMEKFRDFLRAQTDPVFAFVSAQKQVKEAQDRVNEALKEHGRNSPQYQDALLDLAQAQINLTGAASDFAATSTGTLMPVLEQMRDDGLLSKDAFEQLEKAIGNAEQKAHELDGTRVKIFTDVQIQRVFQEQFAHGNSGASFSKFHSGGVIPGTPGQEVLAILQAGERVIPLDAPAGGSPMVLELRSSGSRVDDLLVEILSRAIKTRGGNVQVALGR